MYDVSLNVFKQYLGAEHPKIALPLEQFARLQHDLGHHEDAIALNRQAIHIRELELGPTHPKVLKTKRDYADFLPSIGLDAEAAALVRNEEPSV